MKLKRTGSRWDRIQRININDNWDEIERENSRLSGIGRDAENALREALGINAEAKRVNSENVSVQKQINTIIAESGTSDAEVLQARGGYPVLNERLKSFDNQLSDITTFVTPEMFNAVGDGITDDTESLKSMFEYAVSNKKNIEFGNEKEYKLMESLTYEFDSSLTILGNGSIILPEHKEDSEVRTTPKFIYCIEIKAPYAKVENLSIDGYKTPQDQFDETDYGNLKMIRGIWIEAEDIVVNNVKGFNFYGDMFRFWGFKFVSIDGIYIENVGGKWYENTPYDAFGDAFRFVHHEGTARVKMANVEAYGKHRGDIYSRIAVVNQNSSGLIDEELAIEMENCTFEYFNRNFHVEENEGDTIFNVRNSKFLCGVFAYDYNPSTKPKIYVNAENVDIHYNNSPFNTVLGMYRSIFKVKNSRIYTNGNIDTISSYTSNGTYEDCEIFGISKRQFNGSDKVTLKRCELHFDEGMTDYLNYNSDAKFYDSTFVGGSVDTDMIATQSGTRIEVYGCEFVNYVPYARYMGGENVVRLFSSGDTDIRENNISIYSGGKIVKTPSTARIFPYHETFNDKNYFVARSSSGATDTVPTIPPNLNFPRSSKLLMVMMAGEGSSHLIHLRDYSEGFYYAEVNVNYEGVASVGTIYEANNINTAYKLTIDDAAKTLAKGGVYSNNIHQIFVPFHFKDQLPGNITFS